MAITSENTAVSTRVQPGNREALYTTEKIQPGELGIQAVEGPWGSNPAQGWEEQKAATTLRLERHKEEINEAMGLGSPGEWQKQDEPAQGWSHRGDPSTAGGLGSKYGLLLKPHPQGPQGL